MAKRIVAKKEIKSKDTEMAKEEFASFIERVKAEYSNAEIIITVKA